MLIMIIADKILNNWLCSSYEYNSCLCTCKVKLYLLLLTSRIGLSQICIILCELFKIKLKPDSMIKTSSPVIAIQILLINLKSIKRHIQSVKMCKITKTD